MAERDFVAECIRLHVQDRWEARKHRRQMVRSHRWDTTLLLLVF